MHTGLDGTNMGKTIRITFVGDIMCEKPLQQAYATYGAEVFYRLFSQTKNLFAESDFVVGNLETVFGGPSTAYTNALYRFNTPDDFLTALSQSGIDMVTTATNHCLDCGVEGLMRTLDVLDRCGMAHTGTYRQLSDRRVFVKEILGRRIAFLNYTYGTNVHETGVVLRDDELFHVGLLKPQSFRSQTYVGKRAGKSRRAISKALAAVTDEETRIRLKRALRMPYNHVRVDQLDTDELDQRCLETIRSELIAAKESADTVVACLHCGGQFNREPGELSRFFVHFFAENGADAVVCHHAHVVQRAENISGVPVVYCLGNYSISPSSVYLLPEYIPEYSVALHLTVDSDRIGASFSVLKIVEDAQRVPIVYPVSSLYDTLGETERISLSADVGRIVGRLTGKPSCGGIKREYVLF